MPTLFPKHVTKACTNPPTNFFMSLFPVAATKHKETPRGQILVNKKIIFDQTSFDTVNVFYEMNITKLSIRSSFSSFYNSRRSLITSYLHLFLFYKSFSSLFLSFNTSSMFRLYDLLGPFLLVRKSKKFKQFVNIATA